MSRPARPASSPAPLLLLVAALLAVPPRLPSAAAQISAATADADTPPSGADDPPGASLDELMETDPFGETDAGEGDDAGPGDDGGTEPPRTEGKPRVKPPPRRGGLLPIDMQVDRRQRIPPVAPFHRGREIAQTMHYTGAPWLVRESRQREEDCRMMLDALEIRPGQKICDLGAGNGFYTLELARMVGPEGVVYAVDIQPEMLRMLSRRAAQERIDNLRLILGSPIDPRLPEGEIDLVLCVDVYHEFSHPEAMLARMRDSLAPGGRVALVEFRGEDPAVPIKPLHKMTKAQVRSELEPAGFRLAREFDRLPWQHLMFFMADEGDAGAPR